MLSLRWFVALALGFSICALASHDRSSKALSIGVGGWKLGKDCPDLELLWQIEQSDRNTESAEVKLQFKANAKTILSIPGGMAMFSPDCKHFWYTGYLYKHPEKHEIRIYDTKRGTLRATIDGYFPAWSHDGGSMFFLKGPDRPELWDYNLASNSKVVIHKEQDYTHCSAQGEGVVWYPVISLPSGLVEWTHGIHELPKELEGKEKPAGAIGVKLTIDPRTKRVLERQWIGIICG